MNKLKLGIAIATAAVVTSVFSGAAFAANEVNVIGNGAFSNTTVKVKKVDTTNVSQSNNSYIVNTVNSKANTGGNSSSFNTGGVSAVSTGNANSTVKVNVDGSSNIALVGPDCGCIEGSTVNVAGNGAFSHNNVKVKSIKSVSALQTNVSTIINTVTGKAKTGNNNSDFNTGGGSVIDTGNATSNVTVNVTGSSNTLVH